MHGEGEYTKRPNDSFLSIVQIPERNVAASVSNTYTAQEQNNQVARVGGVHESVGGEKRLHPFETGSEGHVTSGKDA